MRRYEVASGVGSVKVPGRILDTVASRYTILTLIEETDVPDPNSLRGPLTGGVASFLTATT